MEFILFIIGCILSYLSGVFVYSFIAGIISGILLIRETKKNGKPITEETLKEKIDDIKEDISEKKEKYINAKEEAKEVIEDARRKLNDICDSLR